MKGPWRFSSESRAAQNATQEIRSSSQNVNVLLPLWKKIPPEKQCWQARQHTHWCRWFAFWCWLPVLSQAGDDLWTGVYQAPLWIALLCSADCKRRVCDAALRLPVGKFALDSTGTPVSLSAMEVCLKSHISNLSSLHLYFGTLNINWPGWFQIPIRWQSMEMMGTISVSQDMNFQGAQGTN